MNAAATDYGQLLSQTKPEVVYGDQQHQLYIQQLERLTGQAEVTPAEEKLIHLLAVLVEDYEARNFPVPDAGPLAIVRHLMEAHRLRQKDLVDVFGTESIVSDVLNGKRDLTKEHIRRLSHRFHVSPSVFF
jgi:HTH-type transcriptional regulator / antitoxin HigA